MPEDHKLSPQQYIARRMVSVTEPDVIPEALSHDLLLYSHSLQAQVGKMGSTLTAANDDDYPCMRSLACFLSNLGL